MLELLLSVAILAWAIAALVELIQLWRGSSSSTFQWVVFCIGIVISAGMALALPLGWKSSVYLWVLVFAAWFLVRGYVERFRAGARKRIGWRRPGNGR